MRKPLLSDSPNTGDELKKNLIEKYLFFVKKIDFEKYFRKIFTFFLNIRKGFPYRPTNPIGWSIRKSFKDVQKKCGNFSEIFFKINVLHKHRYFSMRFF